MKGLQSSAAVITGLALALGLATAARGQYTRPAFGLQSETTFDKEYFDQRLEEAPWQVGGLRVDPHLEIRQISYDTNVFGTAENQKEDLTVTIAAGLDFYLPVGPKSFLTAKINPAYIWWKDLEEERRFIGHYEASAWGFFNRLKLELTAGRREEVTYFSPEVLQRVPLKTDYLRAPLELRIVEHFSWVASARHFQTRQEDPTRPPGDPLAVSSLDRDETFYRTGFRYWPKDWWYLGLGFQWEETDFLDPLHDRSNEGESPLVELKVIRDRAELSLDVVFTDLEGKQGSLFQNFDEPTGRFRLAFTPKWRFTYFLYGSRTLVYSLSEDISHNEEDRLGVGLGTRISDRATLSLFVEGGELRFTPLPDTVPRPPEDYQGYGGRLSYSLHDNATIFLGGHYTRYESDPPGTERSLTRIDAGVTFTFKKIRVTVR